MLMLTIHNSVVISGVSKMKRKKISFNASFISVLCALSFGTRDGHWCQAVKFQDIARSVGLVLYVFTMKLLQLLTTFLQLFFSVLIFLGVVQSRLNKNCWTIQLFIERLDATAPREPTEEISLITIKRQKEC